MLPETGWVRIKRKHHRDYTKQKRQQNDIFIPAVEESMIHYFGRERGYQN